MNFLIHAPVTASLMLTVTALGAAIFLKTVRVRTPRLRQLLLLGVLLQGLMLFRMPVELPWLVSSKPNATALLTGAPIRSDAPFSDIDASTDGIPAFGVAIDRPGMTSQTTWPSETLSSGAESFAPRTWILAISTFWLAGFSFVVLRATVSYVRLCFLVRLLPKADASWSREWNELCETRSRNAPLMLVSETAGPMLVRRPVGYAFVVPAEFWESLSVAQRRGVMLHELAHLCRRDVWRQLLVRAIAALHWWNPAAWWCVHRFEECTEWACDEWLTKDDPDAAHGLAASLIKLLEFVDSKVPSIAQPVTRVGVQSMAAPPLTERVTRLLKPSDSGDSTMKRLLYGSLAAGLLTLSVVQFQLVAAPPQDHDVGQRDSELNVLSPEASERLTTLRGRLNLADPTTEMMADLLDTDAGKIALSGAIERLEERHRDSSRADAIPNFVASHFEETAEGALRLRSEHLELASDWIRRSKQFGDTLDKLSGTMQSIAERIESDREVDQMAKRMLTDQHAALVITMEEFDGQVDPIERSLREAFEDFLVDQNGKLIVIPTLDDRRRKKIAEFEQANEIFDVLYPEIKHYAKEYATPDEAHRQLVTAMVTPAFATMIAMDLANDEGISAAAAVDEMIENFEHASRDTPAGLVIHEKKAWEHIERVLELSERATQRFEDVKACTKKIVAELDISDPMTLRFSKQLESDVVVHFLAAEIPYAELDLAEQLEQLFSSVMEPAGDNRLRVQEGAAEHVAERASEILSGCRRIRRFVRQINLVIERLDDQELAKQLGETGRLVLLADIRESVERGGPNPIELLQEELFEPTDGDPSARLTVRADRAGVVRELRERSNELKEELANDDF